MIVNKKYSKGHTNTIKNNNNNNNKYNEVYNIKTNKIEDNKINENKQTNSKSKYKTGVIYISNNTDNKIQANKTGMEIKNKIKTISNYNSNNLKRIHRLYT